MLDMHKWTVLGLILILGNSCGKVENTNSPDAVNYSIPDGTTRYKEAARVLRKYCINCHTFAGYSEQSLLTTRSVSGLPYVQARSLEGSPIYTIIRGNLTSITGRMPPTSSVTANDLVKIQDWILNM